MGHELRLAPSPAAALVACDASRLPIPCACGADLRTAPLEGRAAWLIGGTWLPVVQCGACRSHQTFSRAKAFGLDASLAFDTCVTSDSEGEDVATSAEGITMQHYVVGYGWLVLAEVRRVAGRPTWRVLPP